MRTKRSSNSNMRFLKGNVLFFALLLLAIMLFTFYAFKEGGTDVVNNSACRVSFAGDCECGECEVLVGDSLLYAGAPLPVDSQLVFKRYATAGSKVSLYTSKSLIKVIADGDTVSRALGADRLFVIACCDGKVVIDAVEQ